MRQATEMSDAEPIWSRAALGNREWGGGSLTNPDSGDKITCNSARNFGSSLARTAYFATPGLEPRTLNPSGLQLCYAPPDTKRPLRRYAYGQGSGLRRQSVNGPKTRKYRRKTARFSPRNFLPAPCVEHSSEAIGTPRPLSGSQAPVVGRPFRRNGYA
jgi:hypothetical protein